MTYTYDRRGRQTTMAAGGVTTTRKFNDAGNLLSEAYSGGPLNGLTVTNRYDAWLRRATNGLWNGSTWLAQTRYGYDEASRLRTVAAGTNTVAYSYLADSPLVGEIGFTNGSTVRMTTSKSYDYLNRLTAVDSRIGVAPVSISTYGYNPANQRTSVTNLDNARWVYQYDALGQVISGKKYWSDGTPVAGQHFEYAFDDIGNRQSTKAGGDNNGANLRPALYLNNSLNQIASREVPSYVNVLGTASNTATVTLWGDNGQYSPTTRKGEYFRGELYANNTTGAVWLTITNVAVLNNGANPDIVTNQTGKVLLSKTPETFAYDADGNLTSDSLWTNVWNGENRRVTIESRNTLPAAARRREQWTHLPDGRWIQRIVSTNNGTSYYPAYTNRYVWDGQVLLAILDHTNGLVMSFMRGLDLSGTVQGAGGVGGVVAVNFKTNGTHFYCYDGNGNVTALVSAAGGAESARYEYGPFAEPIRMTGPMAKLNPIRFSTQYADDVTGDVKYLFRDYSPTLGRWPNRDPIGELGGYNLYAFLDNDPLNWFDYLGMAGSVCCAEKIEIKNIKKLDNKSHWGHEFDAVIDLKYLDGKGETADCQLIWNETTDLPAIPGHKPNEKTDMYSLYPQSPTFAPWKNRTKPTPGSEQVVIHDPPALGKRPGRNATRTLKFEIIVKSGKAKGCSCDKESVTVTATQYLEMKNGEGHAESFKTP